METTINTIWPFYLISFVVLVPFGILLLRRQRAPLRLKNQEKVAQERRVMLESQVARAHIEQRHQNLMDILPDAIFVTDYQGVLKYVNQAAVNLLGYSNEELLEQSFFELVPEEWRDIYERNFLELIEQKNQVSVEIRLKRKDEMRVILELTANSVLDDGLVYGIARDIQSRNESARKMKLMVERLSLATSAAKMGVVDFDIVESHMVFDHRGCELHGFPAQDDYLIEYGNFDDTLHPEDRERVRGSIYQGILAAVDFNFEFRVILPEGQTRHIEIFFKVLLDAQGKAERMMGLCHDITRKKLDEYEINQLAYYDPLTKLPNRRLLMDRLKHAVAMSEHAKTHGAVLFLDLDHFKSLNDTRGHDVGDLLLLEVSSRLQAALRKGDSVARQGGDEFVVVLESLSDNPDQAIRQAELVAEKIRNLLSYPYDLNGYEYHTSSSIGISLFSGYRESVDNLLKHADSAMYQAKSAGRGVYRFFDPVVQNDLETRTLLKEDLIRAAEREGELELYYQVQMDRHNQPVGAEVLLRWNHPARGTVYPSEFIPLAEETGLIVPIGEWILKSVMQQLQAWQDHPQLSRLCLAVNVSEKQFRRADFVERISRFFDETGAKPERLKLEITESSMLQNISGIIVKMEALKKLGVRLSLDDFGTGYSSLAYLKKLPLHQLKIDQSFVRDIATDPNDATIVVTIIAMAKALGLDVLAEGVETLAQRDFLERNGCYAFQGYLFGKPMPLDQFEKMEYATLFVEDIA